MLGYARLVLAAREAAERHDSVATMGKVSVVPNGVNAIASQVTGWLDARGADRTACRRSSRAQRAGRAGRRAGAESWTDATPFDAPCSTGRPVAGDAPVLATGAGHDAGILANAGIPTAMLFVRNPTGSRTRRPSTPSPPTACPGSRRSPTCWPRLAE